MRGDALAFFSLMALAASSTAPLAQTSDEQRARICQEAEERYQQIYGKPSKDADAVVVTMYKHTFCPPRLTVKKGRTVRWINVDRRTTHSVWFRDAGQPESERLFTEEKVEMTIDLPPGEHTYLCGPHWKEDGMTAVMIVVP